MSSVSLSGWWGTWFISTCFAPSLKEGPAPHKLLLLFLLASIQPPWHSLVYYQVCILCSFSIHHTPFHCPVLKGKGAYWQGLKHLTPSGLDWNRFLLENCLSNTAQNVNFAQNIQFLCLDSLLGPVKCHIAVENRKTQVNSQGRKWGGCCWVNKESLHVWPLQWVNHWSFYLTLHGCLSFCHLSIYVVIVQAGNPKTSDSWTVFIKWKAYHIIYILKF